MRRIVPLFALVPALALALLAGCGSGTDTGNTAPPTPTPTALPRFTSVNQLSAAIAEQQQRDRTAKISLAGEQRGQTQSVLDGEGALRYDEAGPAMQLTQRIQTGAGAPLELGLVLLPDAAFVRPPANAGTPMPAGKTWLHVKPGSTDPVSMQFNQSIQAIRDNVDPTIAFAQFGDAITIADTTEEPLDGVPAMRYRLQVDLAKAAERQADPTLKQRLQQSGLTTLEYALWLDSANRLTRALIDQVQPQNQGTFSLEARYRDWGQPVQIEPPPPAEVLER